MFTTSLKRAGLALAAITGLGLAGCGDDAAPEATFLPGDYVAGAVFDAGLFVETSAKDLCCNSDRFAGLEVTVAEDGTIEGTFTDYVSYYLGNAGFTDTAGLPDDPVAIDGAYDVTGTVEGVDFTATVDVDDEVEVTIEGTITPTGYLTGEILVDGESAGYAGGVVTNDENVNIACGYFDFENYAEEGVASFGYAAFLSRGDSELFGVLYDWDTGDWGFLDATFDNDSEDGTGTFTGTFDDVDLTLDAELVDTYVEGDYLEVGYNSGFTGDYSNSGFYGDTENCYNWD